MPRHVFTDVYYFAAGGEWDEWDQPQRKEETARPPSRGPVAGQAGGKPPSGPRPLSTSRRSDSSGSLKRQGGAAQEDGWKGWEVNEPEQKKPSEDEWGKW